MLIQYFPIFCGNYCRILENIKVKGKTYKIAEIWNFVGIIVRILRELLSRQA